LFKVAERKEIIPTQAAVDASDVAPPEDFVYDEEA